MPELTWRGKASRGARPAELQLSGVVPADNEDGDNRLLLGDCLDVMQALRSEFESGLDLVYADPPFLTGKAYRARTRTGEDSRSPEEWQTTAGFSDEWPDSDAYLELMHAALRGMHALLKPTGTLVLHLDWHAAAYGKLLLDEVFGTGRLLNEIVWVYHGPSPIRSAFKRKHDTLYVYTKSDTYTFNADAVRVPYDDSTRKTFQSSPRAGFGKQPDLDRGKVPEDWWYFPVVARLHKERTGYPTQKPEALLERLITALSNPGERVADFFCGSGTTPAVAERLGRRWLACDRSALAIDTSRRRLLLGGAASGFSIYEQPEYSARVEDGSRIELTIEERTVSAEPAARPPELATVEVDWDYDGQVFRSVSRAARDWRADQIQARHTHVYAAAGEHTLAMRTFEQTGRVAFSTADVNLA